MKISGLRIAHRYVKALLEVAEKAKATDAVEKDMQTLAKALEDSKDFQYFLTNPLLLRQTQAGAMTAILDKIGASDVTKKFITMLADQRRLELLADIARLYSEAVAKARGEVRAELVTAVPLKREQAKQIADRLSAAYGKTINLEVRQDPSLLGGVIMKIGSLQLDSSLAGKLRRLKNVLHAA